MKKNSDISEPAPFDLEGAMLDATPDCIKIFTPDGNLLAMNRAGCTALGVPESEVKGTPWIPLLPPSTHEAANEALVLALTGSTARFAGYSEALNSIIYWDNLLTPVVNAVGISSIVCVSRDVTEQTLLQRELNYSLEREQLLSGEMLHRIKNLFTVVGAIVMISDRESRASGRIDGLAGIVTSKLGALARAYEAVFAGRDVSGVDMETFIGSVLHPFGAKVQLSGPTFLISQTVYNTIALFCHELATNSVKHGSLSVPEGRVHVCWSLVDQSLNIGWREFGGPTILNPPVNYGFGTHMIDRLVASTNCIIVRNWLANGLQVELKVPLNSV